MLYYINSPGLDVLLGLCACVRVCVRACVCEHVCASAVSMAGFQRLFILVFLFSPLATPPWITALRLLRSLFLGPLIDMQQPTSHYGVFYALRFCTLSFCIMLPFLALCELLISKSRFPLLFFKSLAHCLALTEMGNKMRAGLNSRLFVIPAWCHKIGEVNLRVNSELTENCCK